jgi:methyl-accepting chemotaxis protein
MVLLMLGITAVFLYDIDAFRGKLTQINAVNAVKQRHAINFSSSVHDRSIAIRDVVMLPAAERAGPLAAIEALAADYARNERALAEMTATAGASGRERALFARIDDIRMRTDPVVDRIIDRTLAGDSPAAEAALAEVRPLFVDWLAAIDAYIDHHEAENQRIAAEVRDAAAGFTNIASAAMGAAALLAVLAGFLVTRSITRPVRSLSSSMRAMADGNYAVAVAGAARRDEIGEMAGTVEVFRKALLAAQEDQRRRNETREAATRNAEAAARRQERVVRDISAGLERLAAGNLTQPIESPANDPFPAEDEMLRQSYNNVLETLGDIVAGSGRSRPM